MQSTQRADFLVENLDLPTAAQFPGAKWEPFQLNILNDDTTLRIDRKSRQAAWSWTVSGEAAAVGILNGIGTIFQSINLQEAQEKIRYAKNIIAALPKSMRPKLVTDNKQEIEFDNGARLISLASNPQRGKAQFNVVFDEFAHIKYDRIVYRAALPVISKGNRRLRIGSSPAGAAGMFWEIFTQEQRPYPAFSRHSTNWWMIQAFCTNIKEARQLAPALTTEQRVLKWGNDRIKLLFNNMPLEDFSQEFDCAFLADNLSWISWSEIKSAQDPALVHRLVRCDNSVIDTAIQAIQWLAKAHNVERFFTAGYDVGRKRNLSELFILGINELDMYPVRLVISLFNCSYESQMDVLRHVVDHLPVLSLLIDMNGLGMQLAETLEGEYPGQIQGYQFTNASKTHMATTAKKLIQLKRTPLPVDRDMAYQIQSVKRMVSSSKNLIFDTDGNEKHHADKFWAWCLALVAIGHNFDNNEQLVEVPEAAMAGQLSRW